eukprot:TRINITY_DN1219_c0_g1_i1.p2 TRINITY_DN1219_c0_g1~~TRINITY_DN1219_c0_g1_i1.p2  ORF type:complete len:128 (+),score=42.54 TRINITY_DN1219_c0_g1_i1:82-465(+)
MAFVQGAATSVQQQQQQPAAEEYQVLNDVASSGFQILFKFLALPGTAAEYVYGGSRETIMSMDKAIMQMDLTGHTAGAKAHPPISPRAPPTSRSMILSPRYGESTAVSPPRGPRTPAATPQSGCSQQ